MGRKTVRLDEATYERLKRRKREDETFSEAIDRLIGEWTLFDLVGTLAEAEAAAHRRAIERATESKKRTLGSYWSARPSTSRSSASPSRPSRPGRRPPWPPG